MTGALPDFDVVVVGGGPSGLMAAYFAAQRGLKVAVVDKNRQLAKKLRITGKGRCNLTNDCDAETFLSNVRRGAKFLQSSLSRFSSADVMEFFKSRGLELITERGGRVFPKSQKAESVAETLIDAARDAGVFFLTGRASEVELKEGAVTSLLFSGGRIGCDSVIIATGGLSYPKTGSTGDGYNIAEKLSHTITPLQASLVPVECEIEPQLQGLSLKNVELIASRGEKAIFCERGELLFTHFGMSGPLVLSLSSHLVGEKPDELTVYIDLKPALSRDILDKRILRIFSENLNRCIKNSLDTLLPKKLIRPVIERSGINPDKRVNAVSSGERASLVETLKRFSTPIKALRPIDEAVVTAGGVDLSEIDPKTMMSKKVKNLYFAGEVIDADGYTGGFNLGIAFATGAAAGRNVLDGESLLRFAEKRGME